MFRLDQARPRWLLLLVTLVLLLPAGQAAGQESLGETTSLGQVPEDIAFYSALLNGRRVYDAVVSSNAVQRVLELPATEEAIDELVSQLNEEGVIEWLAEPENEQLARLLIDMASHEVFICGDEGLADMTDLYSDCVLETMQVQFGLYLSEEYGSDEAAMLKATLDVLARREEAGQGIQAPNLVIGFKLTQQEAADAQLARLEELLRALIAQREEELPDLADRLQRVTVAGSEFLTLRLDGSLLPWDDFGNTLEIIGYDISDYQDLRDALAERELLISVGVKDGYALLAIGPNHDFLANLGAGPALWDREELAPLRAANPAAEEVLAVGYISDSMADRLDGIKSTIDTSLEVFAASMNFFGGSPSTNQFVDDLPELRSDLFSLLPERKAMLSYSLFTERGLEGYVYDRSTNLPFSQTDALPVVQHAGEPLLLVAGHQPYSTRAYDIAAKWFVKVYEYQELDVKAWGDERMLREVRQVREELGPMLKELDDIVRTMLLPSLDEGQRALVLDADVTSDSWFPYMDEADGPLPMVEVGVVIGVSDRETLIESCTSGGEIINDMLTEFNDITGEFPEDVQIPPPHQTEVEGGILYTYPWEEVEFHEAISPAAILTDDWLIVSLSPDHCRRMLPETPLPATPPLARCGQQPMAGVIYLDVAGAVDAVEPWVDYFIAGNDIEGQHPYRQGGWEDEVMPAEQWNEEGDPFEEDPFGGEGDPEFDGDPFHGEDPFRNGPAQEFDEEFGPAPYGRGHRRAWSRGEVEATADAVLNLCRSLRTFSAVMYEEDDVMVTHFEWHIVDAGAPPADAEPADTEQDAEDGG